MDPTREYYKYRKRGATMTTKTCKNCGNIFTTEKNAAQYCSKKCRRQHNYKKNKQIEYKCSLCGKTFTANRKTKYCSTICRLRANGRIKGIVTKTEKPVKSLAEINKAARALNMSYGQYMARYGYKNEDKN
jgi:hypothetical protein